MPLEGVIFLSLKDLPVLYNAGTAGTIADIVSGSLFVMTQGANAAGTTSAWVVNFHNRVYFTP